MQTRKLENATRLYMEGIRDGHIHEALDAYIGDRYTQHATGVADGKEGFVEFFEPFMERNPARHIEIVRAVEDGSYVFVHAYQSLNHGKSQWVTCDLFDTDTNDKIIEHWDAIQAYQETSSPCTMVNGPSAIEDIDQTDANKAIVRRFCQTCLIDGDFGNVQAWIAQDVLVSHNPNITQGVDSLVQTYAAPNRGARYWKVHQLIGQGNFVVTMSHKQQEQSHFCVFDIYRLKDGRIHEHWDSQEKLPAPEAWRNQGKF